MLFTVVSGIHRPANAYERSFTKITRQSRMCAFHPMDDLCWPSTSITVYGYGTTSPAA